MAQHGPHGLGRAQEIYGYISECVQGILRKLGSFYLLKFANFLQFTGDGAGRDHEGYYWIRGRVDDVVNVSGHRLSTAEIEAALVTYQGVAEAAVVGSSDELTGQCNIS